MKPTSGTHTHTHARTHTHDVIDIYMKKYSELLGEHAVYLLEVPARLVRWRRAGRAENREAESPGGSPTSLRHVGLERLVVTEHLCLAYAMTLQSDR